MEDNLLYKLVNTKGSPVDAVFTLSMQMSDPSPVPAKRIANIIGYMTR